MAISGGFKFFDQSKSLYKNGTTGVASSNSEAVPFMLDTNKYTQWESVASNDLTEETITITLDGEKTFNRVFLCQMNLKEFSFKYLAGAVYTDFTNVIGVNGVASAAINETDYSYIKGWAERFKTGNPVLYMDKQAKSIYINLITKW